MPSSRIVFVFLQLTGLVRRLGEYSFSWVGILERFHDVEGKECPFGLTACPYTCHVCLE